MLLTHWTVKASQVQRGQVIDQVIYLVRGGSWHLKPDIVRVLVGIGQWGAGLERMGRNGGFV